jgi:hypothetical protein
MTYALKSELERAETRLDTATRAINDLCDRLAIVIALIPAYIAGSAFYGSFGVWAALGAFVAAFLVSCFAVFRFLRASLTLRGLLR